MGIERKDINNSDIPLICQSCEARHGGVCGALTSSQLTKLNRHTTKRSVSDATELHTSMSDKESHSNILSGVVKLTKLMADGRQQIVGLQFAPDFVGRPFSKSGSVTAIAATEVRLCSFPRTVLEEILSESPKMEHRLHKQTLKELDEARDWLLTLGRKTAYEKVASFLYLVATHIDPELLDRSTPATISLPMKRGDIADYLGLTIETVSRQITNLRKANLIEIPDRRSVLIPNLKKLETAAGQ